MMLVPGTLTPAFHLCPLGLYFWQPPCRSFNLEYCGVLRKEEVQEVWPLGEETFGRRWGRRLTNLSLSCLSVVSSVVLSTHSLALLSGPGYPVVGSGKVHPVLVPSSMAAQMLYCSFLLFVMQVLLFPCVPKCVWL